VRIAVPILISCLGRYAAPLVFPAEEAWSLQPRCHTFSLLHLVPVSPRRFPSDAKDPKDSVKDVNSDDLPDEHAQHGVKMVEAVTLAWTKKTLATAYIL
jgi:hypothetical protein